MFSLSPKRFIMGAFLVMACGYVAGGPSCDCDEIGVSGGYEHQSSRMGVFARTEAVVNGRWVYKNSEDQYLYFPSGYMWMIGEDYTSTSAGVVDYSYSNALCPNDVGSNFQETDGSEWGGSVAVVCRVPAPTGCDEVALSGEESTHSSQMGKYTRTNTRTADGRWVYKHDNDNYLFYWPQYKDWRLGRDYKYPLAFLQTGNAASLHPTEATAWYKWSGGQWALDANIQAECSGCGVQVLGSWQPIQYSSGSQEISYYAGFEQSNGYSSSSTFRSEISTTVAAGFSFGPPSWLGSGEVSGSVEVTASLAAEFTNEVSSSMSISRSTTQTYTFDKAGQVWQWVYLVRDACRASASNTIGTKNLVRTQSRTEKPCCPAGYAADASIQHGPCAPSNLCSRDMCPSACDSSLSPPPPLPPPPAPPPAPSPSGDEPKKDIPGSDTIDDNSDDFSNSSDGDGIAPIVGGAVGGLVATFVLVLVLVYLLKKRAQPKVPPACPPVTVGVEVHAAAPSPGT